ncbi:MAG TPA: TadE family protein [Acidobacteriaceae bacterium]|jgi:Flp pilus assembly protein TadG
MTDLTAEIPFASLPRQRRGYWKARSTRREEAQSLVELALLVPLFAVILAGSAEFGRFAWDAILTANAARAGAAYGAASPTNAGTVNSPGVLAAAANESGNLPGLVTTSTVSCYCAYGPDTGGQCSSPDPQTVCVDASGNAIPLVDYITVNTTSTVTAFGHQFTATGQSTMVIAK